jgi:hypothetical protein
MPDCVHCPRDHGHIKFLPRKTMEEVLKETGFTNIEFTSYSCVPCVWKRPYFASSYSSFQAV